MSAGSLEKPISGRWPQAKQSHLEWQMLDEAEL